MAEVSFTYEVPMGHRLMNHAGKCRFPHGHNYVFQVFVSGPMDYDGMVLDFAILKGTVRRFFEEFDHAFVLSENDPLVGIFRESVHGPDVPTKVVVINAHPTAENLAALLCDHISTKLEMSCRVFCNEQRDCCAFATDSDTEMAPRIVDSW